MNLSATSCKLKRIDGHAHVFLHTLAMIKERRYTPEYNALAEDYYKHLKVQNLNGSLLVQPSFLGTDNSFLLEVLAEAKSKEPDLLIRGVAVLDPSITAQEMLKLKSLGITGVRLNCLSTELPDFENETYKVFLSRIDALGWHVEVQVEGHRVVSVINSLIKTNRRIVIDHFGLPENTDDASFVEFNRLLQNTAADVSIKTSAPYRVYPNLPLSQAVEKCGELAGQLIATVGPQKLIWGSDWPWTQHEDSQSYAECYEWGKLWFAEHHDELGKVPEWLMNPDF